MTQKVPTNWSSNISAETNLVTYDSAVTTYDSATVTYDSVVIGDLADTDKVPTAWTSL